MWDEIIFPFPNFNVLKDMMMESYYNPFQFSGPRWGHANSIVKRFHSLILGWYGSNFKSTICKRIAQNSSLSTRSEVDLMWMPENTFDDKSTLVQLLAWCSQATNHYMN